MLPCKIFNCFGMLAQITVVGVMLERDLLQA